MNTVTPTIKNCYIKNDGTCQVKLIIYVHRSPLRLNTNVYINPKDWNDEKKRVKGSDPDYQDKNLQIQNCISRIIEIHKKYRLDWKDLTPGRLKQEYKIHSTHIDLYEFIQSEINKERQHVEQSTIIKRQAVLNNLMRYKPVLYFSELDENVLKGFDRYLRVIRKNKRNTRAKTMDILRHYIRIALRSGKIEQDPFLYIKIATEKTDIVYLDQDELNQLIKAYSSNRLKYIEQKALRRFLFCCCTGLRISDLEKLCGRDIVNGTLTIVAHKTRNQKSKHLEIPLIPFAEKLISDENTRPTKAALFTGLHRATISRHLKNIAANLNIDKAISTKTGRHTFATLFLENGGSLEVLQQLLGHSNIRETMVYVHVTKDRISSQMDNFGNLF